MKITPVKTPVVAKKIFPSYIWDIAPTHKELYLTFDDGPTPKITNWTLDILKQYDAKATFFCIGNNIDKHPSIYNDILKDGHTIGNHTQNHVKGWSTKTKAYVIDVNEAQTRMRSKTHLFRPPYGQITPKQGKKLMELGYKVIMWDILSFDWDQNISEEKCLENVISKSKAGSIIVFHDSIKASKNMMYTLPKVLEYFSKKGYKFKSLS
ncbi:polysaccharide deacetylase family protein [Psychroserpens damuponensis]|uniref:polysaccharide deacetylase family protein n=1 Tax=Psychroserpens damuponensis TaxID=943936 RepID=UPI00058BC0CA|nr:polysaccharide deacetylase family protein [Psychroserpens damuponensis]